MSVEDVPVAKVGDARAAKLSEAGERRAVPIDAEHDLEQVAPAFQRRAVMRRSERYELAENTTPRMVRCLRHEAGAASQQPAHAVRQEYQLIDRPRPRSHQLFEQLRERSPVLGDVQPAVV